ncbi:MAG: LysE/ArgO family amino acid transporter [Paracoccaceae bacterium]|nr:LysE/ArgO family amino acid transporter [Paracoccaceae bacterium]MDP7185725.1 LysE/ArgO family amino acid transporter [Paracoccaceae bacterium]
MENAILAGFALGFSLILAIGAQNAFVLRQGLKRSHVFAVCLACALSDAILIVVGVAGFGFLSASISGLAEIMRWGGAVFLIGYGALAFRSAWRGGHVLSADGATGSLRATLLTSLALTWLNPHVYLDTVALLGSVSAQYQDRTGFALGAILASFTFFFGLGYGARLLAPVFARPVAWRVLDLGIGVIMWSIAYGLITY